MRQIASGVVASPDGGRYSLVLTRRTDHLDRLAGALPEASASRSSSAGGMGARARTTALARLDPQPGRAPVLLAATDGFVSPLAEPAPGYTALGVPDPHRINQDIPDR